MQLGMIGLGRMSANIARRLMRAGHSCVVYDANPKAADALAAEGAVAVKSLAELKAKLTVPRAAWIMVPAGEIPEHSVQELATLFEPGDVIIDGGNSNWKDDVRRAKALAAKGLHYRDVGTSGGVWGLERGYCMMIGGDKAVIDRLNPIFRSLAPGLGHIPRTPGREGRDPRAEQGYIHAGPSCAGHFVKMVHNDIEYGLMQAYAEGLDILYHADSEQLPPEHRFELNLPTSPSCGGAAASRPGSSTSPHRRSPATRSSRPSPAVSRIRAKAAGPCTRPSKRACRRPCSPPRSTPASVRARRTASPRRRSPPCARASADMGRRS